MREATLRDFFLGSATAAQLAAEACVATEVTSATSRRVRIEDMTEAFTLSGAMLVRLCDAALDGDLPPACLEPIAFAIIASDHFGWAEDDDLTARVLYDWASPEINWELTPESVRMFRGWLTREIPVPPQPELPDPLPRGRPGSRTEKFWIRRPGERNREA